MSIDTNTIMVESIKRLLRRGAYIHLKKIVNKTHAADLSIVFRSLSISEQIKLFEMIKEKEHKGLLFSELDQDNFLDLIHRMEMNDIVDVFDEMQPDDVADIIGRLPEELSSVILKNMNKEGSDRIEKLLKYGDDTAGGIMTLDFLAFKEDTTVREALSSIQNEQQDVEMPFYLYIVNESGCLVGVSSLRQLVVNPPGRKLKDFMTTDIVSVKTDMDQEEVARLVARYDILAVPVVDEYNYLKGIVTVDDVIDILRTEATEDMLKMAGAGEEFIETKSVIKSTKYRLPWLFASCMGGIVAFTIIGQYEITLKKLTYLAGFIPVIMGMGGNIGTQSSTIVVRGLATGRLQTGDLWKVVFKELRIGFILGLIYGVLIGCVAQLRYASIPLGFSVGLSLICSMSIAALMGSLVPMLLAKVHIDPAVSTGPFVTTCIDIVSVSFYFFIATILFRL